MLLNPYRFAAGGLPDVGPHAYWRIRYLNTQSGSYCSVGEIEMAASTGGADQCNGGTAIASDNAPGGSISNAFNNNPASGWYAYTPPQHIGYVFTAPVTVTTVRITAENGSLAGVAASPKDFNVEYSDNGTDWSIAASFTGQTGWTSGETRTFSWGPVSDLHWASVFSLVHFNAADGTTTLTCQKGFSYVRQGDPVIKSGSALYGSGGGKFFGTPGYSYWKSNIGGYFAAAFTMEAMVRFTDATEEWIPFSLDQGSYSLIPYLSGGVIKMQTGGGVVSGVTPVSPGQWVHIAVVKSAGMAYLYVNGVLQGSKSNDGLSWKSGLTLGGAPNYYGQIRNFKGDMDEFRMTDGVARYTANFTPPSAPFPDS